MACKETDLIPVLSDKQQPVHHRFHDDVVGLRITYPQQKLLLFGLPPIEGDALRILTHPHHPIPERG
eukprot:scaffold14444_cov35-Prasinocladus_malaysianus.AAC.1